MMQFNVAQLLKEPIGAERAYRLAEDIQASSLEQPSHVEGELRLTRTDKGIWVHGSLTVHIDLECGRCLRRLSQKVAFELDEEYLPQVDPASGVQAESEDRGSGNFTLDERHVLDLREAVRQYSLAQLPMKTLCRPDCRGLCSQCGADLNQGACPCPKQVHEHRWAALSGIHQKRPSS